MIIKTPLFKNKDKKSENHPDYRFTGEATVNGNEEQVEIAAWLTEAKSGMKYMNVTVKTGDDAWKPEKNSPPAPPARAAEEGFTDDDLPF